MAQDSLLSKKPKDEIWLRYKFKGGDLIVIIKRMLIDDRYQYVLIGLHLDL